MSSAVVIGCWEQGAWTVVLKVLRGSEKLVRFREVGVVGERRVMIPWFRITEKTLEPTYSI